MTKTIDSIIQDRILNHPDEWFWYGKRFLGAPGITLVRSKIDERWTFVVGECLGYVKLSLVTHMGIEVARRLKHIPNIPIHDNTPPKPVFRSVRTGKKS